MEIIKKIKRKIGFIRNPYKSYCEEYEKETGKEIKSGWELWKFLENRAKKKGKEKEFYELEEKLEEKRLLSFRDFFFDTVVERYKSGYKGTVFSLFNISTKYCKEEMWP